MTAPLGLKPSDIAALYDAMVDAEPCPNCGALDSGEEVFDHRRHGVDHNAVCCRICGERLSGTDWHELCDDIDRDES